MSRGVLLGLELESAFALDGVPSGEPTGRRVTVTAVSRERLDAAWPSAEAQRTNEQRHPGGRLAIGVDHHPVAGYRISTPRAGHYVISHDGRQVTCAPPPKSAEWRWQRMLLSQALPVAATAQGLELLHAGGVTLDDRAIGIVGNSGSGKSSLATHMVLRGAGFLTDDVLALEPRDGVLIGHPGAAMVSLRSSEVSGLSGAARRRLGRRIAGAKKSLYVVARDSRALAVAALYFPQPADVGRPAIERFAPSFPQLVQHNFNWNVSTPERLERLLDSASLISTSVPAFRLLVPARPDWAHVAELVKAHAAGAD